MVLGLMNKIKKSVWYRKSQEIRPGKIKASLFERVIDPPILSKKTI